MTKLQGSFIAVVTPMHANGAIHFSDLEKLILWQLQEGCEGLMFAGSTGEAATLTFNEKCEIFKFARDLIQDRVPIIAGTGNNSTQASIELSQAAEALGIPYSLLTCPYYNKPPQEGLFLHYQAIAQATPKMQHILYSIPGRSIIRIENETVIRLAQISNIIGLKDSGSSPERIRLLRAACGPEFSLLSSDDDFTLACIKAGGDGVISVAANAKPREVQALVKSALAGKMAEAEAQNQVLAPLYAELFCQSNPIPIKALLHHMHKIEKSIRLPLTWLDEKYLPALIEAART